MAVDAIGANRHLLSGCGIDWGSGSGVLTVAAAKIPAVESVVGLELAQEDMAVARTNAEENGVAEKITFIRSDSFEPFDDQDTSSLDALVGHADFLIANPPASSGDDGLGWRRSVLRGALRFVKPGAPLLVQISYQYNVERIERLAQDVPGYTYDGVIGTSDWIEFDQSREDLSKKLVEYRDEERAGGTVYTFRGRSAEGEEALSHLTATEALDHYRETGESPMSKWQMHLFVRQWG
jgi:methylase of polypeptide subunit release factors